MAKFSEWMKNRDKGEDKKSSSPYSKNDYARYRAEKSFGMDTFEADLADVSAKLSEVTGGWQTQETMDSLRSSIEDMYTRATNFEKYASTYLPDSKTNIGDITSYYKSALDNWDSMREVYGYYQNADSYDKAMRKLKFDNNENFQNLSYDDVQEMLKQYSPDSDEHRYLSNYTGYTDLKEFDKALAGATGDYASDLKEARNIHALDNKFDLYSDIMKNADYAEKSKYNSTQTQKKFLGMEYTDYGDETYEYINNVNDAREMLIATYKDGNGATPLEQHGYEHMTPDEIGVFNYLYATDKDKAYAYLADIETSLNRRLYNQSTEAWEKMADSGFLASTGMSLATPILKMAGGMGNALATLDEKISGKEYNPYAPLRTPSNATSDIRQYVGENIAENTSGMEMFGQNIPQFLYQTGMSIADTTLGARMFGRGFTAIMGMDAYQQTARQMKEEGADDQTALRLGMASGIAEAVFEYFSIDKLLKINNADGWKNIIKSTLKQAGIEASEEMLTEGANILSDLWIRQDKSEIERMKQELRDRGFSEKEISDEIKKKVIGQIGWAGAGGALSGLAMGGTSAGSQYHGLSTEGKQIASNERTQEMVELAGLTDKESETYKLYTEYANKGVTADNIKPAQLGNLRATMENEVRDTLYSKKTTNEQKLNALDSMESLTKVDTAKTEDEKTVERLTTEAKAQAQENQTRVNEMVQAEGREDISFYSESMEQAKAEAFNKIYDGKTDLESYADSFELAYTYGKNKIGVSEALKNKGVLTEAQALKAYEAGNVGRAIEKQARVDAINKQYSAKTFVKGKFDDSIIDYTGNAEGKVAWKDLGASRQNAIKLVRAFAEVTGANVKIITSTVNEQGKRIGENGRYEASTNTIYIDAYAGSMDASVLNDAIIPTVSHEVTHWMKAKAPAMYQKMQDYVLETLTLDGKKTLNEMIAEEKDRMKQAHPNQKVTDEDAIDELVARGTEDMLANSDKVRKMLAKMSKTEQDSFIAKVKETFENIMNWVNDLLKQYKSNSKEAELLRQYKERMKELSKMWDKTLEEAIKTNQSMTQAGITDSEINAVTEKVGVAVDTETESAYPAPQMSERTWTESEYVQNKEEAVKALEKALGVTEEDAKRYIDNINGIAKTIADNRMRLDYEASPNRSSFVSNAEYGGSIDFSTICKKRRLFTGTFEAVQMALPNTALTAEEVLKLRDMMKKKKYEVSCGLCYVEGSRANMGQYTKQFIERYKATNPKYVPNMAEMNTATGQEKIRKEHPEVYEAYEYFMNHYGKLNPTDKALFASQQKPKMYQMATEYKGEILKEFGKGKDVVSEKNKNGGLRLQSFSDFEIIHLIDSMQVIMDMSRVGLAGQAYTKVPDFAWALGDTGLKINLSLIAKGVDANGRLILDEVEGMKESDAMALRNRYSENVGTIVVVFDEQQLKSAMADERIDYIIPYHRSQWKTDQYEMMGLPKGTKDFTMFQNESYIEPVFNKNGKKQRPSNYMPNAYWDFSKSGKENAETYLKMCAENNRRPKFYNLLVDNHDGSYSLQPDGTTDGYWKLLIDFKMYNNEGQGSPQNPVTPDFNMQEAERMLNEYTGGHSNFPVAEDVVDKFVDDYKKEHPQAQYSDRTAPIADEDYKNMAKHFGTTGNFNVAGYMLQDGKILDFSGKHWGDTTSRIRQVDHRDIQEVLSDENNGVDSMVRMISNGNIRLMPEDGGINLAVAPSKNQRTVLRRYIEYFKGEVAVDIDAVGGDTVESFRYDKGTSADRVMRDIDNYFRGGRQSELMRFHTQYADRDTQYYANLLEKSEYYENIPVLRDAVVSNRYILDAINEYGTEYYNRLRTGKNLTAEEKKSAKILKKMDKLLADFVIADKIVSDDAFRGKYIESKYKKKELYEWKNQDEFSRARRLRNEFAEEYNRLEKILADIKANIMRDNKGKELTKEQQEFFKDNHEVFYEDGRLKRYYHGTDEAGFFVFDPSKSDDGLSLFVTDSRYVAGTYMRAGSDNEFNPYNPPIEVNTFEDLQKRFEDTDYVPRHENGKYFLYDTDSEEDIIEADSAREIYETWRDEYSWYGEDSDNSRYYALYVHSTNPLVVEGNYSNWDNIEFNGKTVTTRELAEYASGKGYDSVVINDVFDIGAYGERSNEAESQIVIVFNSNQLKSVYNTNPTLDADIRYSDRDYTSVYELMGEKEALQKQNAELQADIERLKERLKLEKQITNGNVFDEKKLDAVARHLLNISKSDYSVADMVEGLRDVYSYIVESPQIAWDDLYAKAYDVARNVLAEQREQKVENDYFKMILNDIRKTKIRLSEQQIAEAKHVFGADYHKKFFGRIALSKDGIDLDSKWQEWSSQYPDIFDAEITPADQVTALYDIYDSVRDSAVMFQKYNDEESIRALATEIYNQYWNVSTIRTTADKYDKEIKRLNFEHRNAMKRMRDNFKESIDKQKLADRIHYGKIINDVRNRKEDEIQRAKELGKKRVDAYKEQADRNALIQKITAKSLTLSKWMIDNSKKSHVPDVMKPIVRNFLDAIDFSSKQLLGISGQIEARYTPTKNDLRLEKALSKVHRMMLDSNNGLKSDKGDYLGAFFPEDLVQEIGALVERVEDFIPNTTSGEYVLNQMSVEDLRTLDYLVSVLKSSVTNMNKFFVAKHNEGIADLAMDGMEYRNKLGVGKEYGEKSLMRKIQKTLNWNNVNPFFAFKRYGADGAKIFEAFQDGWDKFAFNVKKIIKKAEEIYTKEEIAEWRKDIKRNIEISGGRKLTMTVPQIMSLYELQKREQARKHIVGEDNKGKGIRIGEIEDGKKIINQTEGTGQLTQNDIDRITGLLTPRQKAVADALQEFMSETGAEWGNEVTMKLYGFKGFGEANYFPIKTDENVRASEAKDNENDIFRLLNMSFTKSINEKANNRIMVLDIFDVFAQHTSDMAKYNALALPVYDAFRWYSFKENTNNNTYSVKTSLETAFGKDGKSYIYTFLKDINGAQNVGRDALGSGFLTKAKLASVGANLKVVLLQPTSYARANAVIDTKYLIQAFGRKPKFELAEEYCGIAQWKSLGFYDTNIQKGVAEIIMHDQTKADKLAEASMKGAGKMDEITIGYLWNACEAEVRDKQKNFKDEKEFYKAVGLRLREVIYSTQVVDSTMTRSQLMRSPDRWDKIATNFMSEPTLSYNMLHDAYMDYALAVRETGSKEKAFKRHGKKVAKTITAYTVTSIVTALLEAGFDAFRDDEEELTADEFLKFFLQNFGDNMSLLGKIPYVSELRSVLQGYTSSRMDTQWAQYAKYTINGVRKLWEGEGNPYTTAKNAIRTFSYASGLPFYNVYRDLVASFDSFGLISAEELEEMFNEVFGDIFPSLKIK